MHDFCNAIYAFFVLFFILVLIYFYQIMATNITNYYVFTGDVEGAATHSKRVAWIMAGVILLTIVCVLWIIG